MNFNSTQLRLRGAIAAHMRRLTCISGLAAAAALIGLAAYAATSTIIAVGVVANFGPFGGPATITMRTLTIAPGEVLGWHYHPGLGAYTIVKTGTLTVEDGCGETTVYTEGKAFVEPPLRVHRGKNLTGTPVVTAQTFIEPPDEPPSVTVGQLCGAPVEVDECRNGGWMAFNHPRSFASQGDCVEYVITGKLRKLGVQ